MIERNDYYLEYQKNAANSDELLQKPSSSFPLDGIMIGDFVSNTGDITPALIPIDQTNGICFLSSPNNEKEVKRTIQMMALRIIASVPSSMCNMILYDGQGAGSELIYLSGLSSLIKGDFILGTLEELKEKLKIASQGITDTIQKILGAKYCNKSIVDYNMAESDMSVPYTLIVIADFPHTLDKETINLLLRIAKNGRKAGVYIMMNLDTQVELYNDTSLNSLDMRPFLDIMTIIYQSKERYYIRPLLFSNEATDVLKLFELRLNSLIPDNLDEVIQYINYRATSTEVEKLRINEMFTNENLWSKNASKLLEIPIGKSYDRSIRYLTLGLDHHHCLIGGRSGSGKSILLHNIICNGAWLYSPNELQFVLLDFKDGVEFNAYKNFPNTKILSVQSDISFALNVFRFLNQEITRRAELFKCINASNLMEYNQNSESKLNRYLVIIDEFQRMFNTKDYGTRKDLESCIDNIVRQGRYCGINLILCTQALGDLSVSLSELTLRIGFSFSSERECRRICYDSTIPLGLEIGQAVYCEKPDGSNPTKFKVSYLGKSDISAQSEMLSSRNENKSFDRFIFDGETPATYNSIVKGDKDGSNAIYIGSPLFIKKAHCYYKLKREQGSNLLIVGQDKKAATSVIYHSILQIMNGISSKDAIFICDKTSEDSPTYNYLAKLTRKGDGRCKIFFYLNSDDEISKWIGSIYLKIDERRKDQTKDYGEIFFALINSYNFQPARWKDECISTQVSLQLIEILKNGANYGIHLIVYSDTFLHHLGSFGQFYRYDWGIKIAVKGGNSDNIINDGSRDNHNIKSDYMALFTKEEYDNVEKVMIYNLNI